MRVEVKALTRVLNKVSVCSSKRASLDICQTVRIQNDGDKLNLTCSNIHSYYRRNVSVIPSSANENINVCVTVDSFKQALSCLSGYCDITKRENRLLIQPLSEKEKGSYFELCCQDGEAFPQGADNKDYNHSFHIQADVLRDLLESTYFASSEDELKLKMCGVYFEVSERRIQCTATNGHILSHYVVDNSEHFNIVSETKAFNFLIDIKPIKNLISVLKDSAGDVEVLVGERFVHFNLDIGSYSCSLNSESFPNYSFLFDGESLVVYKFRLNRKDLIEGIKRVIGFCDKKYPKMKFTFQGGVLNLQGKNPKNNHCGIFDLSFENRTDNVEAYKVVEESGFTIGFNGNYMLNCLGALDSEYVVLRTISSDKACFLSPCLEENNLTQNVRQNMVICPMLLNDF
jgi:DNA polymerase-3 subunit beta